MPVCKAIKRTAKKPAVKKSSPKKTYLVKR